MATNALKSANCPNGIRDRKDSGLTKVGAVGGTCAPVSAELVDVCASGPTTGGSMNELLLRNRTLNRGRVCILLSMI